MGASDDRGEESVYSSGLSGVPKGRDSTAQPEEGWVSDTGPSIAPTGRDSLLGFGKRRAAPLGLCILLRSVAPGLREDAAPWAIESRPYGTQD